MISAGEVIKGPKALLPRLSRKQKGSANRAKAKVKQARLHARIAHIWSDALHKLTSDLNGRFHTIVMEDLNVRGMMANRRLSRAIAEVSLFELRRQREYKAVQRGGQVVVAERWLPRSKT